MAAGHTRQPAAVARSITGTMRMIQVKFVPVVPFVNGVNLRHPGYLRLRLTVSARQHALFSSSRLLPIKWRCRRSTSRGIPLRKSFDRTPRARNAGRRRSARQDRAAAEQLADHGGGPFSVDPHLMAISLGNLLRVMKENAAASSTPLPACHH